MKETYTVDSKKWKEYLSFNTYVPITCDDVLNLQPLDQLMKVNNLSMPSRDRPMQYFFGNHPMKWVQVSGKAVSVEFRENRAMSFFRLSDGFGSNLLCVQKSAEFAQTKPIQVGQLVTVLGEVSSFGGELQVVAHKILGFSESDMLRYYALRETAMLVRKHVLERSADEFKCAVKPVTVPKLSLLELSIAETAGLRKFLSQQILDWGLRLDSVLGDTAWQFPL